MYISVANSSGGSTFLPIQTLWSSLKSCDPAGRILSLSQLHLGSCAYIRLPGAASVLLPSKPQPDVQSIDVIKQRCSIVRTIT